MDFHFLIMEKSWKISVDKEGAPCKRWLFLGAFKDLKPRNWCLTEDYLQYTQQDEPKWTPNADYYIHLISRLVDSIFTGNRFSSTFLGSYDLTALTHSITIINHNKKNLYSACSQKVSRALRRRVYINIEQKSMF